MSNWAEKELDIMYLQRPGRLHHGRKKRWEASDHGSQGWKRGPKTREVFGMDTR